MARGDEVALEPLTDVEVPRTDTVPPHFRLASYDEALNTRFEVEGATARVELELVEVADRRRNPTEQPEDEVFSLLFRGPRALPLPQRNHELSHDGLGRFLLFLVPVGESDAGLLYEAIVNRQDA